MSVPVTQRAISQGLTSWTATAVDAGWRSGVRVRTTGSEEELEGSSARLQEVEKSKGSRGEEELRLLPLPLLMAAAAAKEIIIAGETRKTRGEEGRRKGGSRWKGRWQDGRSESRMNGRMSKYQELIRWVWCWCKVCKRKKWNLREDNHKMEVEKRKWERKEIKNGVGCSP